MKKLLKLAFCFCIALCASFAFAACSGESKPIPPAGGDNGGSGGETQSPVTYSLEIAGVKREFAIGEEFTADGIVVTLKGGESNKTLSSEEYAVDSSAYKADKAGEYTIVVTLTENSEITAEYKVIVQTEPPLSDARDDSKWGSDLWL